MPEFTIIEGKKSDNYNIFKDYEFVSCTATDTRLMGVVAMKIFLRSPEDGGTLHLLMHLDFSEYGIDEYQEYFHESSFRASRDKDMNSAWYRISGNLGGKAVKLPLAAVFRLIDQVLAKNELHYKNHDEEIRAFRRNVLTKIAKLHEAFDERLAGSLYYSDNEIMGMISPNKLTDFETINYFIMRLVDCDFEGAAYLSELSEEELRSSPLSKHGITMLLRNSISTVEGAFDRSGNEIYLCTPLATDEERYYFYPLNISLSGSRRRGEVKIAYLSVLSSTAISRFEAAMHLKRKEYITVFRLMITPEEFHTNHSLLMNKAAECDMPNGKLYMVYKGDNSHVDTDNYYMNGDIYGAYIVTPRLELVLMSNSEIDILGLELSLQNVFLFGSMETVGRYVSGEQMFQSFANSEGALFEDMIYRTDD